MPTPETCVKNDIKELLNRLHIFWYWIYSAHRGCYRGLPDLVIHYKGNTIYVEVKSLTGKLTEDQMKFRKQCEQDEIPYWVVSSVECLIKKMSEVKRKYGTIT